MDENERARERGGEFLGYLMRIPCTVLTFYVTSIWAKALEHICVFAASYIGEVEEVTETKHVR